jgi:hypothetical protein
MKGVLLGTVLLAAGAFLWSCKPVEFGTEPVTPQDTAKGESTLLLYNQRAVDQGNLVFQLYDPSSQHIQDVAPKVEFPAVAFEKVISVKVTPGRWKVGYLMETTGEIRAMPSRIEAEDPDWPVVKFVKGETYQILVETDAGNNTVWTHNIPVE